MYESIVRNKKVSAKVILLMIPHFVALMGLFDLKEEESTWSTGTDLLLIFGGLAVFILACLWLHDEEMEKFMFGDDETKSKTFIVIEWAIALFFTEFFIIMLLGALALVCCVIGFIGYGIYWLFS